MKKILILLACGYFIYSLSNQEPSRVIKSAKAAEVEIYTAAYCSECKKTKKYLDDQNISYFEHDVEFDLDSRKEFYARGGKGIPFMIINGHQLEGFQPGKIESLRKL